MNKLSESLEALSARVKKLEDSATAAFEADRAAARAAAPRHRHRAHRRPRRVRIGDP